jgi:hypothetical protein
MRERERTDDSLDELFELLSHKYRRYILLTLATPDDRTDEPVEMTLFAGNDEPDILRIELRHNHLPKLDDAGLVDWDPEAETLAHGPRFEAVEPFLELIDEQEQFPGDDS